MRMRMRMRVRVGKECEESVCKFVGLHLIKKTMKNAYLIKQVAGTTVLLSLIFLSAGRLNYLPGLVYAGIGMVMMVLNHTFLKVDKALLEERNKPGGEIRKWDRTILGLSFLSMLLMYITAGFDSGRYGWSPVFPGWMFITGIVFTAFGQLLFLVAQKENKFFSSVYRIQSERNHTVCDTGLYRIVRHPAYAANLLQLLGFPMLFGSLWAIIPVVVSAGLNIFRTALEDQSLIKELQGYHDYASKTRYRMIPYVW